MADKLSTFLNETYSGFVGSRGELGFTGSRGFTGSSGSGFVGSRGDTGFTGSQGPIGYTGSGGSGGGGAATEVGSSPPETPTDGQLWFDSDDASLNIYYDDGNTSQWVTVSGPRGTLGYTGSAGSFNSDQAIFTGSIQEQTFALTDAATITIEPANGSIQYLTALGASRTIDVTNFVDGETVTLMINDNSGTGSVTTWSTVDWVNNGGSAPTWPDSGNYTVIALWKVNGTVYGALVGDGS